MSDPQQPPYPPRPGQSSSPFEQPGQPGVPAAHAAASDHPVAYGYTSPDDGASAASTSTLGRTAFIVAVVMAAIGLLLVLANPFFLPSMRDGYALYQVIALGRSVLGLVLGALALILGIIAARRRAQPVLAGIAIGVGAVEVLGVLSSFLVTLVYTVL